METRYNASVNGVWLSDLDERIVVRDIREGRPDARVVVAEKPANAGAFFARANRKSLNVTVAFVLWERDVSERKKLLDQVKTWAGNNLVKLKTNDRPGQYLNVRMIEPPVIESAMKWLDEIELSFTAYEVPFWRVEEPVTAVTQGETVNVYIPGNGEAFADVTITNKGDDPFTCVWIYADEAMVAFKDLYIPKGGTLAVYHDETGILHAKANDQPALELRSVESDDDLIVHCGKQTDFSISFLEDENPDVEAIFTVQGVYV